jgi:hypothetical protein
MSTFTLYTRNEIDDLLYVQNELTDNVLDRYDRLAPGQPEAARNLYRTRDRCASGRSSGVDTVRASAAFAINSQVPRKSSGRAKLSCNARRRSAVRAGPLHIGLAQDASRRFRLGILVTLP